MRTYLERKLKAAPDCGHELVLLAPGREASVREIAPGAIIATIPGPELPLDRRYRYFADSLSVQRALDEWRPDHVEASSPWSSATAVGRWQGSATRSLVMHADPLASYAYRWFGRIASVDTIDRWFDRFWRHLRGLDQMFDMVVSANDRLTARLRAGGLNKVETVRMGCEPGLFSPRLRSEALRAHWLAELGLQPNATLLLGLGRFAGEKRWPMVAEAVRRVARDRQVGLLLVGDGPHRERLKRLVRGSSRIHVAPPISDRVALATLIASADSLIHGCESETFCMVAAEGRASGIPLIVPDGGGAADQYWPGSGRLYRAGDRQALTTALYDFLDEGSRPQRRVAIAAPKGLTMDEHFRSLFARYLELGGRSPAEGPVEEPAWSSAVGF